VYEAAAEQPNPAALVYEATAAAFAGAAAIIKGAAGTPGGTAEAAQAAEVAAAAAAAAALVAASAGFGQRGKKRTHTDLPEQLEGSQSKQPRVAPVPPSCPTASPPGSPSPSEYATAVEGPDGTASAQSGQPEQAAPSAVALSLQQREQLAAAPNARAQKPPKDKVMVAKVLFCSDPGLGASTTAWLSGKVLGVGSSGFVLEGLLVRDGRTFRCEADVAAAAANAAPEDLVAVKAYSRAGLPPSGPYYTLSPMDHAEREMPVLRRLYGRPGIVRQLGEGIISSSCSRQWRCSILELCRGSLQDELNKAPDGLPVPLVKHYTRCLLLSLKLLKEMGITHRDLKPSNLYHTQQGSLVIADFSLASGHTQMQLCCGSSFHKAPEVVALHHLASNQADQSAAAQATTAAEEAAGGGPSIQQEPAAAAAVHAQYYDSRVDVWSAGRVVHQMLVGPRMVSGPGPGVDPYSLQHQLVDLEEMRLLVSHCPEEQLPQQWRCKQLMDARSFIRRCCSLDPAARASIDELLMHGSMHLADWLTGWQAGLGFTSIAGAERVCIAGGIAVLHNGSGR